MSPRQLDCIVPLAGVRVPQAPCTHSSSESWYGGRGPLSPKSCSPELSGRELWSTLPMGKFILPPPLRRPLTVPFLSVVPGLWAVGDPGSVCEPLEQCEALLKDVVGLA